jgi:hypothetical protein
MIEMLLKQDCKDADKRNCLKDRYRGPYFSIRPVLWGIDFCQCSFLLKRIGGGYGTRLVLHYKIKHNKSNKTIYETATTTFKGFTHFPLDRTGSFGCHVFNVRVYEGLATD